MCILCEADEWGNLKHWNHLSASEKETVIEYTGYDEYERWELEQSRYKILDGRIAMVDTGGSC